jgi:hypothetical protein
VWPIIEGLLVVSFSSACSVLILYIPVLDVPVLIGQVDVASSKLRCAIKRRISGYRQLCDWHLYTSH